MASDILNSEIFQAVPSDKKESASKPTAEVKKEGLSLFDTLLKDVQVQVEQKLPDAKEENNEVKNNLKTIKKESNTDIVPTQKAVTSTLNGKAILENNILSKDKLTQELKTSEQPQNKQSTPALKVIEKGLLSTTTEQQALPSEKKIGIKIQAEQIFFKDGEATSLSQVEKVSESSNKAPLSLLDKMVQDIKQEVLSKETKNQKETTTKNTQITSAATTKDVTVETDKTDEKTMVVPKVESTKIEKVIVQKDNSSDSNNITQQIKNVQETPKEPKISTSINSRATIQKEELKESKTINSEKVILDTDVADTKDNEKIIDIKQTEVKQIAKNEDTVGKLFAELTSGIKSENKVTKSTIETTQVTQTTTKEDRVLSSLVDSITGKTKVQKEIDQKEKLVTLETPKGQFGANVFLSNQKIQSELLSQQKLNEAKQVLTSGDNSVKSVKKASEILDLKASKVEMSEEKNLSSETIKQQTLKSNEQEIKNQQTFLNRMFLQKDITQLNSVSGKINEEKVSETKNTSSETATTTKDVTVTVERSLVETFTTKVIASKQMMGSFMSDVARNMYLNYKPPITAFKINLDPLNLGSITIVMRNNKSENSLNISLNMSQSGTLDTFNDNKSILQNALGKAFNQNEANISLDFGMQNSDSNQEFEQFRQNQENSERRNNVSGTINQIVTENEEGDLANTETTRNYM